MEYKLLSDELLMKLLVVGDGGAFEEIYRRYFNKLLRTAQFKIHSKEIAEELLQDLFISLWEKRDKIVIDNLEAYLNTSLKYLIINHIRRQLLQDRFIEYAANKNEPAETVDESIAFNELSVAIERSIEKLPEKTRQIFTLNRLEYKSVREISEQLSIPERTVEYHITQGLKILRLHLKEFMILSILFCSRLLKFFCEN